MTSASSSATARSALSAYARQEAEDNVVCTFGPDYFYGARTGAAVGSLFSATLSWYTFRLVREDQREVDFLAGLKRGQRHLHFSAWTIARGMQTQPMLTTGCLALAMTSIMKGVKCYLANLRCREFFFDDVDFGLLEELAQRDPSAAAFVQKMAADLPSQRRAAQVIQRPRNSEEENAAQVLQHPAFDRPRRKGSLDGLLRAHGRGGISDAAASMYASKAPSFYDGVAVAFLGSILDCYLPQKPAYRYHHMRAGMW